MGPLRPPWFGGKTGAEALLQLFTVLLQSCGKLALLGPLLGLGVEGLEGLRV